jgi:HK97 gp10 family phage protein
VGVKYRNGIGRKVAATVAGAEHATSEGAEKTAETARELVPVDTGALQASIVSDGEEARVGGPDAGYAGFVNRGTRDTPPTHFWDRAVKAGHDEFRRKSAEALRTPAI